MFTGVNGKVQLRLGVSGSGDLYPTLYARSRLRSDQPIGGSPCVLVNGPIDDPVIKSVKSRPPAPAIATCPSSCSSWPSSIIRTSSCLCWCAFCMAVLRRMWTGTLGIGKHSILRLRFTSEGRRAILCYFSNEKRRDEPILVDASATGTDLLFNVYRQRGVVRGVARFAASVECIERTVSVDPSPFHRSSVGISMAPRCRPSHYTSALPAVPGAHPS